MDSIFKEADFALTITDEKGNVIFMNDKSVATFEKYGGEKLVGKNLADVHPPYALEIIKEMLTSGKTNVYTIEKNGIKKMIYQTNWKVNGEIKGLIELSLPLPTVIPHKLRT